MREKLPLLQRGSCSSCGAPVLWVVMTSGARMPLNPTPQRLITLATVDHVGHVQDCYTSHFATCPNAAEHRRPRDPRG
jgi:hypothetical protein